MADEIKQPQPNTQDIIKRGNDIYESKKLELEPAHNGKYVVIEVNSGEHFIGATRDEAVAEARKKFQDIILFVRKIGAIEKSSRHNSYPLRYARYI